MSGGTVGRIGVREVAIHAGVSTQTVSRVLNEHPNIRPETRLRVQAAMVELGYRMNNAARALGTATTRTIGIVASDADLYGPAVGIAALESAARALDRWITTAYADASDEAAVRAAAEHLLVQGVDGIVVLAPHVETLEVARAAAPGVHVAAMHGGLGSERQQDAARLIVEHLLERGHERASPSSGSWPTATVSAPRVTGRRRFSCVSRT